FSQTGRRLVERELGIAPTIRIRPGFVFRVIVTRDLMLEPMAAGR
ncbi:MAG: conjugal transfer protein TrbI, partial [Sphingopyxis terrae]